MHNRRKSTRARTPLRWLLPLWGLGAGCFIDLPERLTDAGPDAPAPDVLFGMAPGDRPEGFGGLPEGPGTKPPPMALPDATAPGVGPPPPPVNQPPSDGGPGGMEPPPVAPTEPPPGCVPDVCHSCDGDRLVASENDARCETSDCGGFPRVALDTDPVTQFEVCNVSASQMPTTCDAEGNCRVASHETCTVRVGDAIVLQTGTTCQRIENCAPNLIPYLVPTPAGQPCVGQPGTCDGFGRCVGGGGGPAGDACAGARLGLSIRGEAEQFCARSAMDPQTCRFLVYAGTRDADPEPDAWPSEVSCDQFCTQHGWRCVRMVENDGDCSICRFGSDVACTVRDGCNRAFEANVLLDEAVVADGVLCDCQLPGVNGEPGVDEHN